jgi:hypothetical protein
MMRALPDGSISVPERPRPEASPAAGRPSGAGSLATLRAVGREEWRLLATGFLDRNYRQVWDYAEAMAARAGARAEHVCITSGDQVLGLASLRIKPVPGTRTGIAYVSGGPLVRRAQDDAAGSRLDTVLAALTHEFVARRGFVLRVAPPIGDEAWKLEQEHRFAAAGFRPAERLRPYRSILVDIARPLDEVRAGLAKKWRYHLGRAERAEIAVAEGTHPALFEDFRHLFEEFLARRSFTVDLGPEFYAGLQATLSGDERLYVAIASIGEQPAAGVVASFLGDTGVYLLGASNEPGRAANASYLLQWRAIEAAAASDLAWYDLGGIDPARNAGVHRFKARMGGVELSAPGPYELSPGRLRAGAVRTAEWAFRVARARTR